MTGAIVSWLEGIGVNAYWRVFLISIIPTIEVKGAIPVGVASGLNVWVACLLAICSALVVCPIILFLFRPFLNWLKRFKWCKGLADAIEGVFKDKAEKVAKDSVDAENKVKWYKMIALFLFVALPLPLTGVWTGSGAAAFMDQKYRYSIPPIVAGCVIQSILFAVLIILFGQENMAFIDVILYILTAFIFVSLAFFIYQVYKHRKKKEKEAVVANLTDDSNDVDKV